MLERINAMMVRLSEGCSLTLSCSETPALDMFLTAALMTEKPQLKVIKNGPACAGTQTRPVTI